MATSMAVCSTGGKLTKKRAPPDLLAPTATFAPILWVISFTIDRPRPLPPAEFQSPRQNRSKMRPLTSSGTPGP